MSNWYDSTLDLNNTLHLSSKPNTKLVRLAASDTLSDCITFVAYVV